MSTYREIIVFADKRIQSLFEEYLEKKFLDDKPVFSCRERVGEATYERYRNDFLREIIYPTTIVKIKIPTNESGIRKMRRIAIDKERKKIGLIAETIIREEQ